MSNAKFTPLDIYIRLVYTTMSIILRGKCQNSNVKTRDFLNFDLWILDLIWTLTFGFWNFNLNLYLNLDLELNLDLNLDLNLNL